MNLFLFSKEINKKNIILKNKYYKCRESIFSFLYNTTLRPMCFGSEYRNKQSENRIKHRSCFCMSNKGFRSHCFDIREYWIKFFRENISLVLIRKKKVN